MEGLTEPFRSSLDSGPSAVTVVCHSEAGLGLGCWVTRRVLACHHNLPVERAVEFSLFCDTPDRHPASWVTHVPVKLFHTGHQLRLALSPPQVQGTRCPQWPC